MQSCCHACMHVFHSEKIMKSVHMLWTAAVAAVLMLMCELYQVRETVRVRVKSKLEVLDHSQVKDHRIYLLVQRYMGQQGVGVKALTALQCWASRTTLPVAIVEPALSDSVLTGDILRASMSLADLFDLEHFNAVSRKAGYPLVIGKEIYREKNAKNIILVSFENGAQYQQVWPRNDSIATEECYASLNKDHFLESVVKEADYCVVKVVVVNNRGLTAQVFRDIVGKWSSHNNSVTVVFRKFGPWFSQENGVKCLSVSDNYTNALYHPSARILRDVERYKELYLNPGNPEAVMMRVEHVISKFSLRKCLGILVSVTTNKSGQGRTEAHEDNNIPMVAVDFGKYGSNSWEWYVKDDDVKNQAMADSKEALRVILKNNMSFEDWEETFTRVTGDKVNAGYIAALQRTLASRAECLVLMGGGDFQELVLRDYLEFHLDDKNRCVHLVCVDNERKLRNLMARNTA